MSSKAGPNKGTNVNPGKSSQSEAQRRRCRQQIGVAERLAAEAEKLFPALRSGVFNPEHLVFQARYVLDNARLRTERHDDAEISEDHAGHIITSMREFAKALAQLGVKALGLARLKQSHYLDVVALWQEKPIGDARHTGWVVSHVRRLLVVIGRPSVIPRGARNKALLNEHGLTLGTDAAFLVNDTFDWARADIDVDFLFQEISEPGRRVATKMMHWWGMSLLEVAAWQPIDPEQCSFLQFKGINNRRLARDAEFSMDPAFAAKQMTAIKEAWDYCLQHGWSTICPPQQSPTSYAENLRNCLRHVFAKHIPQWQLKPMQLRDAFFCQVFCDHAGVSLSEARGSPRLAETDRRFGRAWNEAKCQLGVQGAKAAYANKGMSHGQSQSFAIARFLRCVSAELRSLRVSAAWVGDIDVSAGKCLFVQLLDDAPTTAVPRLQELMQQTIAVKLRVVRILDARDLPDRAAPVMIRSIPKS